MSSTALEKKVFLSHYITMKRIFFCALLLITSVCFVIAQSSRPIVTDICAEGISTTEIYISWKLPSTLLPSESSIAIYRTKQKITDITDLKDEVPFVFLPPTTTFYKDNIMTFGRFYYTVLIRLSPEDEFSLIIPGVNATVFPTSVKLEISKEPEAKKKTIPPVESTLNSAGVRAMPLPYLDLLQQKTESTNISKEIQEEALLLGKTSLEKIEPYVFRNEFNLQATGDSSILQDIVVTQLLTGKYTEAVQQLEEFLRLNRAEDTTSRAIFYLGEAYLFNGNYKEALTQFLKVQKVFPELSNKWIQTTLDAFNLVSE